MSPNKNAPELAGSKGAIRNRNNADSTCKHLCLPSSCYSFTVQRCMVLQNTFSEAVASPTDKRAFVTSKFWGLVRLHRPMVSGEMGISARTAARLRTCFEHLAHLLRFKTQTVALVTPEGAKTMTPTTQGRTAPATDHIHLHACAVNGLRHALHLLTHGDLADRAELQRAIGKATRAATAIKRLAASNTLEG